MENIILTKLEELYNKRHEICEEYLREMEVVGKYMDNIPKGKYTEAKSRSVEYRLKKLKEKYDKKIKKIDKKISDAELKLKCEICNINIECDKHHIKSKEYCRYNSISESKCNGNDNLIYLCPNCHKKCGKVYRKCQKEYLEIADNKELFREKIKLIVPEYFAENNFDEKD